MIHAPKLPKNLRISHGSHDNYGEGSCALEWVDLLDRKRRGERILKSTKLTDSPACTCPVIAAFVRTWNDGFPDSEEGDTDRKRLIGPLLLPMLDTSSTREVETQRAWMATDWLARVHAPAFLELAGLGEHARQLRGLAPLVDDASAGAAQASLSAARSAAESAAVEALAPTVATIQKSAQALVLEMCVVGRGGEGT